MKARTRFLITVGLVCHLLLAFCLLTTRLHAQAAPAPPSSASPKLGASPQAGEPITIRAHDQEKIGDVYYLRGDVEITFRSYTLNAGQVTYDDTTGVITATGHVVFSGGPHDEHLTASHGTYNINTDSGRFYDVVGATGAKLRGKNVVLTSSNPFSFTGKIVDKEGRDKIIVHHGTITSCTLPRPKWSFHAHEVSVVTGEDARIFNSAFFLWRLPVFYFPFFDHPVEHLGRKSGLLMPTIGQASGKGTIFGEGVFWAINPSMDATLGAEYYSKRGWAQHGEFRYRPSVNSFIVARYFGVLDRGVPGVVQVPQANGTAILLPANQDQGGQELRLNAETTEKRGLRAVADIDYLSSFVFRAAFSDVFTQAINTEVRSTAFVSDDLHGYWLNAMTARYQNFQSINRGDVITIVHAPGLEASTPDRQLGRTPLYWNFDASAEGLSRREPGFVTADVVGRFDLQPRLSLPMLWHQWTIRPELALRDTWYSDRLLPVGGIGVPGGMPINRHALDATLELRPPSLDRIFQHTLFGNQLKHTIEPRAIYHLTTGVENFPNILRFDERDILSDTNEVEYGVVNRLYAKRVPPKNCGAKPATPKVEPPPPPDAEPGEIADIGADLRPSRSQPAPVAPAPECNPVAHEVISWEVAQKYFFDPNFGGALVAGRRNVFTATEQLTGIAFLTEPRYYSPVISRLRMRGPSTDVEWQLDYDTKKGRINSSATFLNYHLVGDFYIGGGHFFLQPLGEVATTTGTTLATTSTTALKPFNQFRFLTSYGKPNKRGFTSAATFGYDVSSGFLQYAAGQTTYNWDCCGVTFEYRRVVVPGIRNENQFRFALSLANVGTFGTLRRQERLF